MLIAGLLVAGIYSTNVLAEEAPLLEEPQVPVVEETPVEPTEPVEPVVPPAPDLDADDDGVNDDADNCVDVANDDQTDTDENGVGDACEESTDGEGEVAGLNARIQIPPVTFCHWTEGDHYNQLTLPVQALGAHLVHQNNQDIIPFLKNWDAEGQAIWDNDCETTVVSNGGSITIVKEIAEGSNSEATFEFFVNQESAGTLGDGASTTQALGVGSHTISEIVPEGWEYPQISCTDQSVGDDGEVIVELSEGEQVTCTFTNAQVQESCRVEVSSAEGDAGIGNGPAVLAWIHVPGWTHLLESVASWIWDTYQVLPGNMGTDEAKTFTKDFYVDGPVNDATLNLAADNRYWITINGDDVASNTGEFNYGAVTGPLDVTSFVDSGWNTITMKIENIANGSTNPEENPAAGIYHLVVNGEVKEECKQPDPEDESTLTVVKLVENDFGGTATSSDFNMYVTWYTNNTNDESDPWRGFPGDANGTTFTFNPGTFLVGEDNVPGYSMVIDTNAGPRCSGGQDLHEGEDLTCTVINKQLPIGGDNPSCEELEGENGWYGEYFNYSWERPDMYHYYSGYPGETYEPFGDTFGTELWGEPTDNTSTSSDWYDMDDEFRFSRVDADLEFGESFFPFFNAQVEETTYLPNVDYHFGVHWSAVVDVPVDGASYNVFGKVDDDLWIYVNGVRHDFGNPGPTGVHGPVGITTSFTLSDGDVMDVYYAERSPG